MAAFSKLIRSHQGGSDRRPDGSPVLHGHRQRQHRQDGDRRHQRGGRPAGPALWSCTSRTARPTDGAAAAKAAKLVQEDQVDVIFGGIYSSTRQAIKGPAVVDGKTLYIYPEQYEGQEHDPLIFCTGPVPAQQVEPLIPWLMERTGAKKFYLPSADYIWPQRAEQEGAADGRRPTAARSSGRSTTPWITTDYSETVEKIMSSGAEVVFNTIVPPGLTPFLQQLHDSGLHEAGRADRLHVLRRELPEPGAGRAGRGSVRLPRLVPGRRAIRSARSCSAGTTSSSRAAPSSPAAARAQACTAA